MKPVIATVENALPRTAPERQGIASSAVLQFVEALESQIRQCHSFMLLRHGSVIAEGWWSPYGHQYPHALFSLSKSFTSTAVGLAVAEGHFSIDDSVLAFFAEDSSAQVSDSLAAMRVRHLLSMSTGQAVDTWSYMVNRPDGNWAKGFLEVPVLHKPGTHFVYNTGATYMLSAIVQKTTGMTLIDYLQPRLFAPLGIGDATWTESPQGISAGGIGLSLKTEDVARFGLLYLREGMWQGRQILPASWVKTATTSQVAESGGMQIDWAQGYGYQFWRCRHGAYRGDGAFGQYCIVMPEQDVVLAMTSGLDVFDMQQPLDLVWDILLRAMRSGSLPEDTAAHDALTSRLSSLTMQAVQGQPASPIASQVSGRKYRVDPNVLQIETMTFEFTEAGCTFTVKTAVGTETIPCGYGTWLTGETRLFRQPLLFDRTPTAASSAWTDENILTMVIRLIETPFFYTLVCHFVGDEIVLEGRVNVSLESLEPVLLTARA